ncbi:hypothetical protein LZK98_11590 [Sphingomonas cannabina]|uniref:hypothetical protein n=1 Tax=Sphingomonas cannabina TaxID=2899123 RepID=UPI001F20CAED|nr:hypothetical protein [Sphingomonas cannabina]UIJ43733.1 hypothetical protein LZK98_11590 [Sphingomonas cannabina]
MDRWWIIELEGGDLLQSLDAPGTRGTPNGVRSAELPRRIDFATERWDWERGEIVPHLDGVLAAIDLEHGRDRIARAHSRKLIEALLITAGVPIDGLVAREARETGQDLADLVRTIIAKADEGASAEVIRICAKRAARSM